MYQEKPTVLIVDDEKWNLEVLESFLDEAGYKIVRAVTGKMALAAVAEMTRQGSEDVGSHRPRNLGGEQVDRSRWIGRGQRGIQAGEEDHPRLDTLVPIFRRVGVEIESPFSRQGPSQSQFEVVKLRRGALRLLDRHRSGHENGHAEWIERV